MSNDKATKRRELRAGLIGLGIATPAAALNSLADDGSTIDSIMTPTTAAGAALMIGAAGHSRYRKSRRAVRRRAWRATGWADKHAFDDHLSAAALRKGRLAAQVRPSLERRADRAGHRVRPTDYGVYLGKAVTGPAAVRRRGVYSSYEQSTLLYGPPGSGKTAFLIHPILDAPGACVVASAKPDIYQLTHELRRLKGPVQLFNPSEVGGIQSDFQWDPMTGCEHHAVAVARARALVEGTKAITEIQEKSWAEKCIDIVSRMILAARLGGGDMTTVAFWLAHPEREEALVILRQEEHQAYVPAGWANALQAEMRSEADRMKASIWSLARSAVAFMANPVVARACSQGAGASLDIRKFVDSRSTLYLLGSDEDDSIGPLLNALTHYVYYGAKSHAEEVGRLDPPLSVILDEVTTITPVPLPSWSAVARGAGIALIAATQTPAQVRERWGVQGESRLKTTMGTKIILGGIQELKDLEEWSSLVGHRAVEVVTAGESKSGKGSSTSRNITERWEPLMKPDAIRQLPAQHALVLSGAAPAVVVRYRKGQVRAERMLKRLAKHNAKVAQPAHIVVPQSVDA